MRRILLGFAVLTLLATPSFAQSQTHTGKVDPGFLNRYTFTPPVSGQLLATLSWDSSSAQLLLILVCTVEGEEIGYGVGSGLLDRFARLEAGIIAKYPCEIGVMTATSSANYTLNLHRSDAQTSSAQAPQALPASRPAARTVIPGTPRGSTIERIAFTLERAANP